MSLGDFSDADRRNPARVLNRASRLISRHFDRKLAGMGVNVAYLAVLGPLSAKPGQSQKELAASAGSSQAAMAELLARMVREGLLERVQNASDRRQYLFSLAARGMEIMPGITAAIAEGNAEIFSPLGEEGVESLLALLRSLEENLRRIE